LGRRWKREKRKKDERKKKNEGVGRLERKNIQKDKRGRATEFKRPVGGVM